MPLHATPRYDARRTGGGAVERAGLENRFPVCGFVDGAGASVKTTTEQDHIRTTDCDGAAVRVVSVEMADLGEWQPSPVVATTV